MEETLFHSLEFALELDKDVEMWFAIMEKLMDNSDECWVSVY